MKGITIINDEKIHWQTTADICFSCEKCGYCCTATNVHLSKQDIEGIKGKGYRDFYEPSQSDFRIKGTKTERCIFLDKSNKCEIYNIRPSVCREYPFKIIFLDKSTAYIDVLYSCKSIMKNYNKNNKKISNKFFNEVVKNFYFITEKLNLKNEINEVEISLNKKRWKNNINELNYVNDLLELYRVISPEEKIDFKFYIKKFFNLFKNQLKKETVYRVLDLDKNEFYMITVDKNNILIINKNNYKMNNIKNNKSITKKINIKHIKRKNLDKDSKKILINYLENYWGRKTTVVDFYSALEELKRENKKTEVEELQKEVLKRILLLLQFFTLIISEKNDHKEITEKDALETIFTLDSTVFTPMEAILPGVGRRFFD